MKGTTGDAEQVLLTPNEVTHARDFPRVALFVLSNIKIARDVDGEIIASGGDESIFHPWQLDPARLTPLGYKYQLTGATEE